MATRIIAAVILAAGLGFIAWTALSSDDAETVASADAAASDGSATTDAPETTTTTLAVAPENFGARKDLVELDGWLNTTEIDSLDDLDGQVFMVEMWTFGCSNCKARIPHNQELYAQYHDAGFEIVGVHAPEFSYEAEIPNIEEAVERLGVTWPVALDTNKRNFRAWQDGGRRFWPRTYIIDQNGDVRYDHIGEGRYDEVEQTVKWLLDNPPASTAS